MVEAGRALDTTALDPAEARLLDIRIVPHRSLNAANFRVLMGVVCIAGAASSVPFLIMGAWPVAGFMALDIALIYVAFRSNFSAAKAYEDILVTPLELLLAKVSAKGRRQEWRFHPAWVRVDKVEHEEFGLQRLSLRSRGRSVEIASFLGPDAKADVSRSLHKALNEARRGPQYIRD